MSDPAAFLRAIIADPDADDKRLVYADWLEEHGEPARAEFVRLQIEVARLNLPDGPCSPGCPCGGAGPRLSRLIRKYGDEWNPFLPGERPGEIAYFWRRGFVEHVTCAAADWLAHGHAIRAEHPVTSVRITDAITADQLRELEKWKEVAFDIALQDAAA